MSEPCRCERADAIKSLVSIANIVEKVSAERDEALVLVADLQTGLVAALATLAKVAAIVASPDAALVVDRIRGVLEPTPKGTKP